MEHKNFGLMQFRKAAGSPVSILRAVGGPAAIVGRVPFVVVDSVYCSLANAEYVRMALITVVHIVFEAFKPRPPLTNLDTASSVIRVFRTLWVPASLNDVAPNRVEPCPAHSMRRLIFLEKTAARLSVACDQISRLYIGLSAALTNTSPYTSNPRQRAYNFYRFQSPKYALA